MSNDVYYIINNIIFFHKKQVGTYIPICSPKLGRMITRSNKSKHIFLQCYDDDKIINYLSGYKVPSYNFFD